MFAPGSAMRTYDLSTHIVCRDVASKADLGSALLPSYAGVSSENLMLTFTVSSREAWSAEGAHRHWQAGAHVKLPLLAGGIAIDIGHYRGTIYSALWPSCKGLTDGVDGNEPEGHRTSENRRMALWSSPPLVKILAL